MRKACATYLAFARCAAQRFRCASAMRLRASGLNTRRFLAFPLTALVFAEELVGAAMPALASRLRASVNRAISESISEMIVSIDITQE